MRKKRIDAFHQNISFWVEPTLRDGKHQPKSYLRASLERGADYLVEQASRTSSRGKIAILAQDPSMFAASIPRNAIDLVQLELKRAR